MGSILAIPVSMCIWNYRSACLLNFQLCCLCGPLSVGCCCTWCPSWKNSTATRIMFALFLLFGIILSAIFRSPGIRDALDDVMIQYMVYYKVLCECFTEFFVWWPGKLWTSGWLLGCLSYHVCCCVLLFPVLCCHVVCQKQQRPKVIHTKWVSLSDMCVWI